MSKKQTWILAAVLLAVWLLFVSLLRDNLSIGSTYVRWFNDDADRWIYMLRGGWLHGHSLPYADVKSEYPQIPTYLFGLLHVFIPSGTLPEAAYFRYSAIFSLLMLVVLFFTIRMLYGMLSERKWLAYLMLLPGTLYFTYNRFDILPAFFSLGSLWLFRRHKYFATGVIIGIAALTKWYPALLLPVYLSYDYALSKRLNWKMVLGFGITVLLIALSTILTAGMTAFLGPYLLHAGRGLEQVSLPELLNLVLTYFGAQSPAAVIIYIFLVLQFLPAPFSLFVRIDTEEKLLQWILITIAAFVLFSRIYSPQWLLWLMPFLILSARNWFDISWVIIYNLVTYLSFPMAMDIGGMDSLAFKIGGAATAVMLMVILGIAIARAKTKFSWNFSERAKKSARAV